MDAAGAAAHRRGGRNGTGVEFVRKKESKHRRLPGTRRHSAWSTTAVAAGLAAAIGLGGCAAMRQEAAHRKENLLVASGFAMKAADTPEKLAQLQAMPQLRMVARPAPNGGVVYTYADAQGCKCLYTGNAAQYQEYRRLALQQQIAEAQVEAAEANEAAAMDWGWWGPW
jgi:hypothetical protein